LGRLGLVVVCNGNRDGENGVADDVAAMERSSQRTIVGQLNVGRSKGECIAVPVGGVVTAVSENGGVWGGQRGVVCARNTSPNHVGKSRAVA